LNALQGWIQSQPVAQVGTRDSQNGVPIDESDPLPENE
jgi:hypothetical protein